MTTSLDSRIQIYADLLIKWQKAINLVAASTLEDMRVRHFDDSAQLKGQIDELQGVSSPIIYDIGSGAGFPGMVLAIMAANDEESPYEVHLIESDGRKCEFLKTVSRETGVSVTIHNERLEVLVGALDPPDIVTARAFASVEKILDMCRPWIENSPALHLYLLKGRHVDAEVAQAKAKYDFYYKIIPSVIEVDSSILHIWFR